MMLILMYHNINLYVFVNDTATTEIYTYCHSLSLHDALPIFLIYGSAIILCQPLAACGSAEAPSASTNDKVAAKAAPAIPADAPLVIRSEEHTSELQSLMRISYAVFCLKKKIKQTYIQKLNKTRD